MPESIRTEKQFFAALIADGRTSNVFLNGGLRIFGSIIAEDEHSILLRNGAESRFPGTSLIMKSDIATVVPTNRGASYGSLRSTRPD